VVVVDSAANSSGAGAAVGAGAVSAR